jgi:Ca-activated chloride channel family protein
MDLLWPGSLLLLGLIPLLIGIYIWILRRRRRFAVRFSSLALVRQAIPQQSMWRRHLPFALFLLALASLVFAMTRPVSIVTIPTDQTTILLSIDVSLSMRSQDIQPSRLEAAKAAAISFIQRQKSSTQIGLVAFAGFAELVHIPTIDQESLLASVESLTTGRRTAIGSGILRAIDAISEVDQNVAPSVIDPSAPDTVVPVSPGAYVPDIIVLLTDGVSNSGPSPIEAAQQAVDRGIRIYTIGYGTDGGTLNLNDIRPQDGGGFGNFFGGGQSGGRIRTGIDEATLKEIAKMSGGEYYSATSADELNTVFRSLPTYLISKHDVIEISVFFVAIGVVLAAAAIAMAMIWHPML